MSLKFTQEEVEQELADKMPHGRRREVARVSGLGESYIKRQFNPNDETPSCAFKLLQIVCALDEIDPAEGEAFFQTIVQFRELSKPRKPGAKRTCLNTETAKLNTEIAEFVSAKLENKPFAVQMKELLDAKRQIEKLHEELIDEYNRLKEQPREIVIPIGGRR